MSDKMETRKKSKRRISFSSSDEDSVASAPKPAARPLPRIIMKPLRQESVPSAPSVRSIEESDDSSILSDPGSDDDAMNLDDDPDDNEVMDDDDPSDEDEEQIIESIMQPQIDTSKKTARQKAKETGANDHLEFLPTDRMSKAKPALTAEELALKKSENARKRKNQTEKKLDEEKQETINRLLNKQAGKRKGAVKQLTATDAANLEEQEEAAQAVARKTRPVPAGMIRYVNNKEGSTVSIPPELTGHVVLRPLFGR